MLFRSDKDDYLNSLVHPDVGRAYITSMTGMNLSDCSVDDPLPDRPMSLQRSANVAGIIGIARKDNLTIRQLYERLAGSHGKLALVGSVTRIADTMQRWYDMGACDGFILQPSTMPGNLRDVIDLLVPELYDRGLLRVGYEGATLRDHLGLRRPPSRYAAARTDVAAQ